MHFLPQFGCKLLEIKDPAISFSSVSITVCSFILHIFTECVLTAKIWSIKTTPQYLSFQKAYNAVEEQDDHQK